MYVSGGLIVLSNYLAMILCVNDEYSSMTLIALRKKLSLSFLNYNLLKPQARQVSGEDLIGLVQILAKSSTISFKCIIIVNLSNIISR